MTTIYHGTPLTPRDALLNVCKGRAMCVSFFRPDDVEAVEAISPAIMFRQWCVFYVEGGAKTRRGLVRKVGLVGLLRMARAASVSPRKVVGRARYAGSAKPAQRRAVAGLAVRSKGCAPVAHGRANRAASGPLQQMGSRLSWMDGRRQAPRQARVSRPHGGSGQGFGKLMARYSHDARDQSRFRLSVRQRGRDNTGTERVAL